MWRLSRRNLIDYGLDMKSIDAITNEPIGDSQDGLHINPLEFIALLINM